MDGPDGRSISGLETGPWPGPKFCGRFTVGRFTDGSEFWGLLIVGAPGRPVSTLPLCGLIAPLLFGPKLFGAAPGLSFGREPRR